MATAAKMPTHLWVVGSLATLWNAFGAFDYVMTQTSNDAYLGQFSDEARAWFEGFPAWLEAAWALGVWGALAGSLLLLVRSRYAVWAFGVSLLGLLGSTINMFILSEPPAELTGGGMLAMNIVIWAVAIFLFVYARRMHAAAVLR